jgi:N-acetylmuramoyl-L-alanine amidase
LDCSQLASTDSSGGAIALSLSLKNSMLRLPRRILSIAAIVAAAGACAQPRQPDESMDPRIEAVRFWSFSDVTRIAIETHGAYKVTSDHLDSPPRLFFDLRGVRPPASQRKGIRTFHVGDRLVRQIRVAETEPGVTRIVFDLEAPVDFSSSQLVNPDRLMIELHPKESAVPKTLISHSQVGVRKAADTPPVGGAAAHESWDTMVADRQSFTPAIPMPAIPHAFFFSGFRFATAIETTVATRHSNQRRSAVTARSGDNEDISPAAVSPAQAGDGNRSLVRVFGLKIHKVVIDAGHGGHDTGTIGPKGLMEKDLVLDVALRLGRLVSQRLGAEVVYTRSDDTFIPLEERTKIANDEKADLFISVHANSSPASSATGVETFYFNFTSDQGSLDVATRENASASSSIFQLNDLLHKAVLNAKVEESRDFAQKVENSLYAMSTKMNSGSRDRGVKKAPFVVLIGATMPSILAEIGFVSNPHDERLLRRQDQRQKIAQSLYAGISAYSKSLSHMEVAQAK